MIKLNFNIVNKIVKNKLFKNSALGILSNLVQNILFSMFFIIVARHYSMEDFGNYVICNTIYSFILGFSTLGLGNWFIRELKETDNRELFITKFIKIQFILGCFFYLLNVIISFSIYSSEVIRLFSILFGLNIISDNLIYVFKSVGIADFRQEKTYLISTIESFLKFLIGCLVLVLPFSMTSLILLLISLRLSILYVYFKFGMDSFISLDILKKTNTDFYEIFNIVKENWAFVVIAGIAVINWRIGNIFVSKYLTIRDVGFYEIAFKLLSIAYIIPVVISTSVFPFLVELIKENRLMIHYPNLLRLFSIYGFFTFTVIISFSDLLVPFLFGNQFSAVTIYCKQMFLVMIIFPSVLLKANLMIAVKKEKKDMYCNFLSLCLNVIICIVLLNYFKTISVVILAIVVSFLFFSIIQDFILVKSKIISVYNVLSFYIISAIGLMIYYLLSIFLNKMATFTLFWLVGLVFFYYYVKIQKQKSDIGANSFRLLFGKI